MACFYVLVYGGVVQGPGITDQGTVGIRDTGIGKTINCLNTVP